MLKIMKNAVGVATGILKAEPVMMLKDQCLNAIYALFARNTYLKSADQLPKKEKILQLIQVEMSAAKINGDEYSTYESGAASSEKRKVLVSVLGGEKIDPKQAKLQKIIKLVIARIIENELKNDDKRRCACLLEFQPYLDLLLDWQSFVAPKKSEPQKEATSPLNLSFSLFKKSDATIQFLDDESALDEFEKLTKVYLSVNQPDGKKIPRAIRTLADDILKEKNVCMLDITKEMLIGDEKKGTEGEYHRVLKSMKK